jgi:hypothetical protein
MKKLAITSVCAVSLTLGAYAQGLVNWGAISFANMTTQTNGTVASAFAPGAALTGGTQGVTAGAAANPSGFYYALLYTSFTGSQAAQPTNSAQLTAWTSTGLGATNAPTAGRLAVINPNQGAPVTGFTPGVTNSIMMVGWSANLGTTWAAASAVIENWAAQGFGIVGPAFFGTSTTGYITTTDATTVPGVSPFNANPQIYGLPIQSLNTQLYYLSPVPEPATMALVAMGGASLLLFRRRK